MITLAVLFVVDQAVKNWQELTRGAGGLSGVPRIETNTWLWVAAFAALFVVTCSARRAVGRFAVATREDEIAAPAIGIDRFWPRWTAWTLSIAIVALAGALRVQVIGSTNPRQYTLDVAVLVLAMLVVGGMRTVTGAFVGTLLVTAGNEAARQLGDRPTRSRGCRSCSSACCCWSSCWSGRAVCSATPMWPDGCAGAGDGRLPPVAPSPPRSGGDGARASSWRRA